MKPTENLQKPRRLRSTPILRHMVRETRLSPKSLIQPVFIREGRDIVEDIPSFYGQKRYTTDKVSPYIEELLKANVSSIILFGVPNEKDELGKGAYNENGVIQQAIREIKKQTPEIYIITDVCMCEYTSHGHCGILDGENISNEKTLPYLAKTALSHAQAGADMVAPSDMMDNRILAIRKALDEDNYGNVPIMSYAVKYASSFYGPFRDAAGSCPSFGDRKSYQMDYHNKKEALKEALLDINEGADIIMVKPALAYLDVISEVGSSVNVPISAYSVSGEYAMIKVSASAGFLDEYAAMCETATSIFRAGANLLCTYFSKELALAIQKGDIG